MIEPYLRFAGEPGEQWTMFFRDPAGNAMEFKTFRDDFRLCPSVVCVRGHHDMLWLKVGDDGEVI